MEFHAARRWRGLEHVLRPGLPGPRPPDERFELPLDTMTHDVLTQEE